MFFFWFSSVLFPLFWGLLDGNVNFLANQPILYLRRPIWQSLSLSLSVCVGCRVVSSMSCSRCCCSCHDIRSTDVIVTSLCRRCQSPQLSLGRRRQISNRPTRSSCVGVGQFAEKYSDQDPDVSIRVGALVSNCEIEDTADASA